MNFLLGIFKPNPTTTEAVLSMLFFIALASLIVISTIEVRAYVYTQINARRGPNSGERKEQVMGTRHRERRKDELVEILVIEIGELREQIDFLEDVNSSYVHSDREQRLEIENLNKRLKKYEEAGEGKKNETRPAD